VEESVVVKVVWPLLGQIGDRGKRRRSIEMLLGAEALPGSGWRMLKETAWRSGIRDKDPYSPSCSLNGGVCRTPCVS